MLLFGVDISFFDVVNDVFLLLNINILLTCTVIDVVTGNLSFAPRFFGWCKIKLLLIRWLSVLS